MDTIQRKKLPYGTSNFEKLISEGYYYVDKTRFIEYIENELNSVIFFTRPRKFGKSLFLNMLWRYYDVCHADKFETLFGEYYIGQHPTPMHNNYVVLNLDFSGIDTYNEERFLDSFAGKVVNCVTSQMIPYEKRYPEITKELSSQPDKYKGVKAMNMIFDLAERLDRKVYVIIDEYDHFANDLIAMGTSGGEDIYRRMIGANGIVRDFYETLKAGTKSIVDRVLLSGVTPIMLDDLTSGFNITNNISLKEKYNEILGFTQDEIERLIEATDIDRSLINVDLEHFYNGYLFHEEGKNRVYNSAMMLYYFSQIWEDNRSPRYLIDSNLKMDYGRLKRLIQSEENRQQLIDIVKNNGIAETVIDKFSLHQLTDSACFASLLYYMGLLTIDNSIQGRLWLKIPNYSTYTIYWGYIEELTRERNREVKINTSILTESLYLLGYKSQPQPFINYISQNIVSRLSNRDLEQFDEKYLKIILMNNLLYSQAYLVLSETEVSTGYTDIYVQHKVGATVKALNEWVLEVKYIKKSDENNAAILQSKRNDARRQLEKYRSSHLFRDRTDVKYLMVIFIGKDKVEMEEYL